MVRRLVNEDGFYTKGVLMSIQIFNMVILMIFLFLFLLSRKEKVISSEKVPFLLVPFYRITVYLFERHIGYRNSIFRSEKIKSYLRVLNPHQRQEKSCREYYFTKFSLSFMILFISCILSFLISFLPYTRLKDGNVLIRDPDYKNEEVILQVTGEKKESKGILKVRVDERKYTNEELETMYEQFLPALEKEIMGDNQDANKIQSNMNLITAMESYPFLLEWSISDPMLMDSEGKIKKEEISDSGELVELTARITYEEFQKIYIRFVRIYPPELSEQERFLKSAERALKQSSEESRYETEWKLPEKINGESVVWEERKGSKAVFLLGVSCAAAVFVFFLKDSDLKKKVKAREQEILWEYPTVVSRLTLYLNAGMTIKSAWKKAADGQRRQTGKKYVYEEMQLTCYEMNSGIPETEAYERFGKRCALQPYIKLTTLLTQNIKKGNSILLERLKEETQLALLDRKNKIRIAAEEAGTKLLIPMMLMMAVVMILIMVPAFNQF